MAQLEIHPVRNKKELNQIFTIRKQVFIQEQHVPEEEEMDGFDTEAEQFIAYYQHQPIGCARIRTNKLERIAILRKYRGNGYGTQLTKYLINHQKNQGFNEIYLYSQTTVSEFYTKLGFKKRGPLFYEAGIEHIEMYMKTRT